MKTLCFSGQYVYGKANCGASCATGDSLPILCALDCQVTLFADLELREFSLVSDAGDLIMQADLDQAALADYACGLFVFEKPAASGILSS